MKTREIFSILILMLGVVAAVMPGKDGDSKELKGEEMSWETLMESKYVSVDELAHLLISGDPSIQLIDLRSIDALEKLLPGAINIPLDSIYNENFEYLFDQDNRKNIIYAKSDSISKQVWMIMAKKGYPNNYILEGGLESWNSKILDPQAPGQIASQEEIDLYNKRLAARMHFTGAKALPKIEFKVILPQGGKKKKRVAGGCS
ncbi:MAG: rhodanese-like domain-containing protein [Reichenbachiella sp.]|uniref:rhodanese-like domain-containing protein n=1 Tax=Reichenbachiella sp. TaxID=2184521 RepID=UPI003267A8D6